MYFVVDRLDECEIDSLEAFFSLMKLYICQEQSYSQADKSCKVKWLLTSRPEVHIKEHLTTCLVIDLRLKSAQVAEAVSGFIAVKVKELTVRKEYGKYDSTLEPFVEETLYQKADGTFFMCCFGLSRTSETVGSVHQHENRPSEVTIKPTRAI